METKKARPLVYEIYGYLCKKCVGKQNCTTKDELAIRFGIDTRAVREFLTEINNRQEFDKIVVRKGGVYIAEQGDDTLSYLRTIRSKGLAFLYEAWVCENKHKRAGQCKIPLGEYFKEACETYIKQGGFSE